MFNTYESGIWRLKSIFERLNNDTPLYIFLTTKWNITIFFFINIHQQEIPRRRYLILDTKILLYSENKFPDFLIRT